MGSLLVQAVGVVCALVGVAFIYWPLALILAGAATFGLGWLLDGDTFAADDMEN